MCFVFRLNYYILDINVTQWDLLLNQYFKWTISIFLTKKLVNVKNGEPKNVGEWKKLVHIKKLRKNVSECKKKVREK
jgi:hypothetical protein